jgi:hypothetical protein
MNAYKSDGNLKVEGPLDRLLSSVPEDSVRFRQLCGEVQDWDQVFHWALHHGVESILHRHLIENGFELPPSLGDRLHRWQIIRNLWQAHAHVALDEALCALESASIPAVALKGPILGERLYPDPHMRSSSDLDLLVSDGDLDKAIDALRTIGYRAAKESQARFLRKHHYHIILSRSCPPVIELHFRLSDSFGVDIAAEQFLSRAGLYRTVRGAVARVLSPEDEMLFLSIHAAGHRFERLSWLYDIKLLLRRCPNLDWKTLAARAKSLHVLNPLLFTCETLQSRLGVTTPLSRGMRRPLRSRVANFLLVTAAKQPDPSRRSLAAKMAFTAALCDRPEAALQFLWRQFVLIGRRRANRHFPALTPEEWSY